MGTTATLHSISPAPRATIVPMRGFCGQEHANSLCASCGLRELCLPAGLNNEEIARLDQIVHRRRPLKRGEYLYRAGGTLQSLHAVRTGFLKSCVLHDDGRELILCGDINIARADIDVHPRERKEGVIGQRPEERDLFEALLGGNLIDVTRALDPDNERLFSWWPPWRNMRQRNIGWRIDYILASRNIAERATQCRVLADVGTSDHAPIMLTMA